LLVLSIFNERGPDAICQQRSVIAGYWGSRANERQKMAALLPRAFLAFARSQPGWSNA